MSTPRYVVGIDLGTTGSAMAFVDTQAGDDAPITVLPIPQVVAPGQVEDRKILPSFLYLPAPHDLPEGSLALPWDPQEAFMQAARMVLLFVSAIALLIAVVGVAGARSVTGTGSTATAAGGSRRPVCSGSDSALVTRPPTTMSHHTASKASMAETAGRLISAIASATPNVGNLTTGCAETAPVIAAQFN